MNKPHKHATLIKAWADNPSVTIQCRPPSKGRYTAPWQSLLQEDVIWNEDIEYRIKPKTIKYRVGLFLNEITGYSPTIVITKETEKYYSSLPHFDRWLSDWQEVEV